MNMKVGTLYIVGTPIGNLEDMTFRAIKTLSEVDLIAAEDTRVTKNLLSHFKIPTETISYHRHSNKKREDEIISLLVDGKNIALVTDAGMPAISDPGYELVQRATQENINVIPIPGVSAPITALSVSGFNSDKFLFLGFLPRSKKDIVKLVEPTLSTNPPICVVAFEAPHRIAKTLTILNELSPDMQIVIARELTKKFEEIIRGTATELAEKIQDLKGEIVLIWLPTPIDNNILAASEFLTALEYAKNELKNGESIKTASQKAKEKYNVSKKDIYNNLLKED